MSKFQFQFQWTNCLIVAGLFVPVSLGLVAGTATGSTMVTQEPAESAQPAKKNPGDLATDDPPEYVAFEKLVRSDLLSGYTGDGQALKNVLDACQAELQKNPGNSMATVIMGAATVFQSGQHFESGNFPEGMKLWSEGLQHLDRAAKSAPDSALVKLYRGETLIEVWIHDPQNASQLAGKAAQDLDYVYRQAPVLWNSLSEPRKTNLLTKLPAAFEKIDQNDRANEFRQLAGMDGAPGENDGSQSDSESGNPAPPEYERLDLIVREDLFAGMSGDRDRHRKAMNVCEERLTDNPQHAGAMSFHGWGLLIESQWKREEGDLEAARKLEYQAMQEMNQAVSLQPDNVGPLLVRGSVLMGLTTIPDQDQTQRDLFLALSTYDFEEVYRLQTEQGYFQYLSEHAQGEMLFGLADVWHRRGNLDKAGSYYQMVVDQIPDSDYANDSRMMLLGNLDPAKLKTRSCSGCH